jgi:glycosyltransferase involved in cell wall biosynthesis
VRIAIFDYKVQPSNPVGGCHWRLLRDLSATHEFTVFAVEFVNPRPDCIEWVRIPAPTRPLVLLFVVFHLLAPFYYAAHCLLRKTRFHLVQIVESNLTFGDISYAHFCHKRYLRSYWKQSRPSGLRRWARWLDHKLHALLEAWVFRRVGRVITPSIGLAKELVDEYPFLANRVAVVSNPIDIERLHRPPDFDRGQQREKLGIGAGDCVFTFVALGHFERKALAAVLEALTEIKEPSLKLVVVGGSEDQIRPYRVKVESAGIAPQVLFCGLQTDVRSYLWIADGFLLPSHYETFSLVAYEAAAAELPLIVSRVHGVDEIAADRDNALLVEPNCQSILQALREFLQLSPADRRAMGIRARQSVESFGTESFVASWRRFYEGCAAA